MKSKRLELALALLVAALFSDPFTRIAWTRLWGVFTAWRKDNSEKLDEAGYTKRITTCRSCPIFFAPLSTCGSPLTRELSDLGCWCHMPTAARLKSKTCWWDDNAPSLTYGWREHS